MPVRLKEELPLQNSYALWEANSTQKYEKMCGTALCTFNLELLFNCVPL